jgi:hypothetical protein
MADASEPDGQAVYQLDLKKAKESAENARAKVESAAQDMFQFYANLLAVDAKYAWNKNIQEQTQSDPCTDLQGISKKGPRGLSRTVFDDCMMFHLLTVFFDNLTEQERYYLTNVIKKRQHVIVGQLVQCVKQLNSYIVHSTSIITQGNTLIGDLLHQNMLLIPFVIDPLGRFGPLLQHFLFGSHPASLL